jgi:hypothetical protein
MPRGTARLAPAALRLHALTPTASRPLDLVAAAAKERDAVGRTAPEGRRPVPASGAAVLASTPMASIASTSKQSTRCFGLGEANNKHGHHGHMAPTL